jgi:hypothetical protein
MGTEILMDSPLSIILPARNEAGNLAPVLAQLAARFPAAEILVVDDGSTDATARIVREQGARQVDTHASLGRRLAHHGYNRLASWMTGYPWQNLPQRAMVENRRGRSRSTGDPHGTGSFAGSAFPPRCRARRRHPVLQGSDRSADLEVNMTDLISEADYWNALAALLGKTNRLVALYFYRALLIGINHHRGNVFDRSVERAAPRARPESSASDGGIHGEHWGVGCR